ncbi:helix-turn-helix domain-containing protein [Mangrovicella endophytica]|uniref:helix-turn-helix domain-containing protein n=1 Tax=Mangrovicella endophytica TaxID=2066697 RepID=UPI000C9DE28B|nr:helix-turn-helix transcriptional regulator [Mangrovicella endophytica]
MTLTPRETECLALVSQGLTSDEIAGRLNLSRYTVDNHIAAAVDKLQAMNRTHAVAKSIVLGLI